MRVFVDDFGPLPFVLLTDDGETLLDLTGFSAEWSFSKRDGTTPTGSPISGIITDAVGGEVEFDLPASFTTEPTKYTTIISILKTGEKKSSERIIALDVDSRDC